MAEDKSLCAYKQNVLNSSVCPYFNIKSNADNLQLPELFLVTFCTRQMLFYSISCEYFTNKQQLDSYSRWSFPCFCLDTSVLDFICILRASAENIRSILLPGKELTDATTHAGFEGEEPFCCFAILVPL